MCGFAGIFDKLGTGSFENKINCMTKALSHRGPDEQKTWINKKEGIYLGFCRLSMVDITDSSQPMIDRKHCVAIMFNGEIYNTSILRQELLRNGVQFRTQGEVEVLLNLYLRYGASFFEKLDGMFSICIIDWARHNVFLIRDRFGIKPLYYFEDNNSIVFASELKAIRACHQLEIDDGSIELYINYRFIPAPFTIYKNVKKLKAGEVFCYEKGQSYKRQYYSYNKVYEGREFSKAKFLEIVESDIQSTYSFSDVPIGIFLSGAIDSGIIASFIKKELRTGPHSFCVDYASSYSTAESAVAQSIARELGFYCNTNILQDNIVQYINKIVYSMDEPFYSTVSPSTYFLAQNASKYVKGVLTGDGSDELVFGYKYLRSSLNTDDILGSYLQGISWLKYIAPEEILKEKVYSDESLRNIFFEDCYIPGQIDETLRRVELFKRLPDYHLARVDRLSMASGLEVRVPYLRNRYSEFMLSIPSKSFLQYKDVKGILKNGMGELLPKTLKDITKKPFTAPTRQWIEKELKEDIYLTLTNSTLIDRAHLIRDRIESVLFSYSGKYEDVSNVWGIYLLLKWIEIDMLI